MREAPVMARRTAALAGITPFGTVTGGIVVRPLPAAARFSLRLDEPALAIVREACGFALATPVNRFLDGGTRLALRLGPDEWLLLAAESAAAAVASEISAALRLHRHALVDISHRHAALEVAGVHAPLVIAAGCPLDLDVAEFPSGSGSRTLLGKAEVVLMRTDDAPSYRIECGRSFGPYLADFLSEAAREFHAGSHGPR